MSWPFTLDTECRTGEPECRSRCDMSGVDRETIERPAFRAYLNTRPECERLVDHIRSRFNLASYQVWVVECGGGFCEVLLNHVDQSTETRVLECCSDVRWGEMNAR